MSAIGRHLSTSPAKTKHSSAFPSHKRTWQIIPLGFALAGFFIYRSSLALSPDGNPEITRFLKKNPRFRSVFLSDEVHTLPIMSLYVSHDSACWYWRHANDYQRTLSNRCEGSWGKSHCDAPEKTDFDALESFFGTEPIHYLVSDASQRILRVRNRPHVCTRLLPLELFCSVTQRHFVASPELTLALLAKKKPPLEFIEICMEFMGAYALRNDLQRGFATRREPLATRDTIAHALQIILGRRSRLSIASLIEYAASGSRSPMETREYLLLFLPKRYGGYGLPKATMNARINLSPNQQKEARRNYVECDLYWPDHKIAIEYDGDHDHSSYGARTRDATKRNVLQGLGIRQFTITACQILDAHAFAGFVRNIASVMKFRLKDYPNDWPERHKALRDALFKSMG